MHLSHPLTSGEKTIPTWHWSRVPLFTAWISARSGRKKLDTRQGLDDEQKEEIREAWMTRSRRCRRCRVKSPHELVRLMLPAQEAASCVSGGDSGAKRHEKREERSRIKYDV